MQFYWKHSQPLSLKTCMSWRCQAIHLWEVMNYVKRQSVNKSRWFWFFCCRAHLYNIIYHFLKITYEIRKCCEVLGKASVLLGSYIGGLIWPTAKFQKLCAQRSAHKHINLMLTYLHCSAQLWINCLPKQYIKTIQHVIC